jgi:diamine N-acetyltransferase
MDNIDFKKITKDNLNEIGELTVLPNQVGYSKAGNWKIIAESNYYEDSWIRGIYFNNKPIGLIMLSLWEPEEWYAIWKLMIDHKYQKMGFGKKVVEMAILEIKKNILQPKLLD